MYVLQERDRECLILKCKYMKGTGNRISLLQGYNNIKCAVNPRLLSDPCDLDPQKHVNDIRANRFNLDWYFASLIQG